MIQAQLSVAALDPDGLNVGELEVVVVPSAQYDVPPIEATLPLLSNCGQQLAAPAGLRRPAVTRRNEPQPWPWEQPLLGLAQLDPESPAAAPALVSHVVSSMPRKERAEQEEHEGTIIVGRMPANKVCCQLHSRVRALRPQGVRICLAKG